MDPEEKRLLEDILFQMHVICMILFANMQDEIVKESEFVKNGVENEMTWMKGFLEARKEEKAKARDPFEGYWETSEYSEGHRKDPEKKPNKMVCIFCGSTFDRGKFKEEPSVCPICNHYMKEWVYEYEEENEHES
jgi:rubrerythrin